MKTLNKTSLILKKITVALLPLMLAACSEEESKIVAIDAQEYQSVAADPVVIAPVSQARLGSFVKAESFTVAGLGEGVSVQISVSEALLYKVERAGEVITMRSSQFPTVSDFDVFYEEERDLNNPTTFNPIEEDGFTKFSSTVMNGDVVTIATVAAIEPNTEISGLVALGSDSIPVSFSTGEVDTTPEDLVFIGVEDSVNAAPGETLTMWFYVKGIDYSTPISIVADNTPMLDDAPDALGSVRYSIGNGIPEYGPRELGSTLFNDTVRMSDTQAAIAFYQSLADQEIARDVETQVRKEFADQGIDDEVQIVAEIDARLPDALAQVYTDIEIALQDDYAKNTLGQLIRVWALAPLEYDQQATVTFDVGGIQQTWNINTFVDTSPDATELATPVNTLAVGESYNTEAFTVTGINTQAVVSITGGLYSVNGGEFTSEPGLVEEGMSIVVQVPASDSFDGTNTATINIGGVESQITVTTEPQDIVPDVFSFDGDTAAPNTYGQSNTVEIGGINDATAISISGGEYQIGQGEFTSDAGTVQNGDTVTLRVLAGANLEDVTSATVTIGGIEQSFEVIAALQLDGQVLFPPVNSFTDSSSVFLRGTLTPPVGATPTAVTVNGETAALNDDYSWSLQFDALVDGENELTIAATDDLGGLWQTTVSVTKGLATDAFPVGGESFEKLVDVAINLDDQKYYVMSGTASNDGKVFEVDMMTGQRSLFVDVQAMHTTGKGTRSQGIAYSSRHAEAYVGNFKEDSVYQIPVSGDATTRLTTGSILSAHPGSHKVADGGQMHDPVEMDVDAERNLLVVATENGTQLTGIVTIDLESGDRSLLVAQKTPDNKALSVAVDVDGIDGNTGDRYFFIRKGTQTEVVQIDLDNGNAESVLASGFTDAQSLDVNRGEGVLVVADTGTGSKGLKTVSLADGSVTELSMATVPSSANEMFGLAGVATEEGMGFAVVVDHNKKDRKSVV